LTALPARAYIAALQLLIVHFHLRPGGVRRILELAVPELVRRLNLAGIVCAVGEAADPIWNRRFIARAGVPVRLIAHPSLGYFSENRAPPERIRAEIRAALERIPDGGDSLLWVHNLGVGRNLLLGQELSAFAERRRIPMVCHHHDWWFDNRWQRRPEFRRAGFSRLDGIARAIFPVGRRVQHVAINQTDAVHLQKSFGRRAHWLPNLSSPTARTGPGGEPKTRRWLRQKLGINRGPIWIVPCRLLRRKNLAEAILLQRWFCPNGWLITTAGVSSSAELAYAQQLQRAIVQHRWRVRLGVLATPDPRQPDVADLLQISQAVLLTSIQEGFGLPYLEAVRAGKPLLARQVPHVFPDLLKLGFRFPHAYRELWIDAQLFDRAAEQTRQRQLFRRWQKQLPAAWRNRVRLPVFSPGRPIAFCRLTLSAQLEVLSVPPEKSWDLCARHNPELAAWPAQIAGAALAVPVWPAKAERVLGAKAYGEKLAALFRRPPGRSADSQPARTALTRFITASLRPENLFPLLWDPVT
jgi:glycosyltransferase involved in cell wall biosynthesis